MTCRFRGQIFKLKNVRRYAGTMILIVLGEGAVHLCEGSEKIEILDGRGAYRSVRVEELVPHTHQEISEAIPTNVPTVNAGGGLVTGGRAPGPMVVQRVANQTAALLHQRSRGRVIMPQVLTPAPPQPVAARPLVINARSSREFARYQHDQVIRNNRRHWDQMAQAAVVLRQQGEQG
jgi:hypothetical protein